MSGMIFEVIPPAKAASEAYSAKCTSRIVEAINEMKDVDTLNVPEIVEENHIGMPYYRNADARKFGALLKERCKKDIIVNNVVVHHKSTEKFKQWLDESISQYGIKNFVFVGAKIDSLKYPGPSVTEANLIAKEKGLNFGNILIPHRTDEADRLISKTKAGCRFFTSQVLFESDKVADVIREYSEKCSKNNLEPAKFFLSFAPVSTLEDIAFIKWLGTQISPGTENRLKNSPDIGKESVKQVAEVVTKVSDFVKDQNIDVPLGLNVEYITLHNLELAKRLENALSELKLPVE